MTQLTKDLLADGLLVELEHAPSQGGRPARMLGLAVVRRPRDRRQGRRRPRRLRRGRPRRRRHADRPSSRSTPPRPVLCRPHRAAPRFIAGGGRARCSASASACPAASTVRATASSTRRSSAGSRCPSARSLRRELQLPVLVENNVNALAMAERLYGVGRSHDNFLVVTIGTGVGAGIVVDGVVLRGFARRRRRDRPHAGRRGRPARARAATADASSRSSARHALVRTARERGVIGQRSGHRSAAGCRGRRATRQQPQIFSEAGHLLGRTLAGIVHTARPGDRHRARRGHRSLDALVVRIRARVPRGAHAAPPRHRRRRRDLAGRELGAGRSARSCSRPRSTPTVVAGDQGRLVRERLVEHSTPQVHATS